MNDAKVPVNRKTGSLIAKNIIIFAVLVAVCGLSMWAWFTTGQTSYANGIKLQSKADGVEISWDGETYYKHLTAMSSNDVVEGQTGLAKNISGEDGVPASLKLVTGNGLNFFNPVINRRTGDVLLNSDGSWKGNAVENGEGKYIDVDLYFRAMSPHSIYLAGDSKVSPKNPKGNPSDYGDFSKDYIAAASRIAFLNGDKTACSWIWAPNADIELKESDEGYKKLTETTEKVEPGTGTGIPDEILENSYTKPFYFWIPKDYITDAASQMNGLTPVPMHFENIKVIDGVQKGLFVCEIDFNYVRQNESIPFVISDTENTWNQADLDEYMTPTLGKADKWNDSSDLSPTVKFSNGTYNVNIGSTSYATYCFYLSGFSANSNVKIKIGYNPTLKEFIVLGYSGEGKEYNRGDVGTTEVSYYVIPENETLALASEGEKMAVSSIDALEKSVNFKSAGVISPVSIGYSEQFTVKKNGDKADATYLFVNSKDKNYLKADRNGIAFVPNKMNATSFELVSIEGIEGPVLQTTDGQSALAYSGGRFKLVAISQISEDNFVSVFMGTSYELNTASTTAQDYTFYKSGDTVLTKLNSTSTPPLFASSTTDTESKKIGLVDATHKYPVATLTKEANSDYYTAHIVVRIWVEGTDRDALQPLADGLFDIALHFVPEN